MGVYKTFNKELNKWQLKGCGFVKYYNTEAEADADFPNMWDLHMKNLEAWNTVSNMLVADR